MHTSIRPLCLVWGCNDLLCIWQTGLQSWQSHVHHAHFFVGNWGYWIRNVGAYQPNLSISVCLSGSTVCLSVCLLSVCLSTVCLSVYCLSVCLLSVCLFVFVSISVSVQYFIHLPMCKVCMSVSSRILSVCLPVYWSAWYGCYVVWSWKKKKCIDIMSRTAIYDRDNEHYQLDCFEPNRIENTLKIIGIRNQ